MGCEGVHSFHSKFLLEQLQNFLNPESHLLASDLGHSEWRQMSAAEMVKSCRIGKIGKVCVYEKKCEKPSKGNKKFSDSLSHILPHPS